MNLCNSCLFYSSECKIMNNEVFCMDCCHHNNGKYDKDTRLIVDSLLMEQCENYHKSPLTALYDLQEKYNITILYAVESGSRCWGFDNKDSDYDIRFIFKYNDFKEYLQLGKRREVISDNDGLLDMVGWDITKTLLLAYKSNPSLHEWMLSDSVYVSSHEYDVFVKELPSFDYNVLLYHYSGMAWKNWNDYCEGVFDWVGGNDEDKLIKKYLYVLRCILTWHVLKETSMVPKINFYELVNQHEMIFQDSLLKNDIYHLLGKYKRLSDTLTNKVVNRLRDYIVNNLKYMKEETKKTKVEKKPLQPYNEILYNILIPKE